LQETQPPQKDPRFIDVTDVIDPESAQKVRETTANIGGAFGSETTKSLGESLPRVGEQTQGENPVVEITRIPTSEELTTPPSEVVPESLVNARAAVDAAPVAPDQRSVDAITPPVPSLPVQEGADSQLQGTQNIDHPADAQNEVPEVANSTINPEVAPANALELPPTGKGIVGRVRSMLGLKPRS
jgi:hypothetical protein